MPGIFFNMLIEMCIWENLTWIIQKLVWGYNCTLFAEIAESLVHLWKEESTKVIMAAERKWTIHIQIINFKTKIYAKSILINWWCTFELFFLLHYSKLSRNYSSSWCKFGCSWCNRSIFCSTKACIIIKYSS